MEVIEVTEAQYNYLTRRNWILFHRKDAGKFYIKAGIVTMQLVKEYIEKN